MDENGPGIKLPGFRFKPTEEELLNFYLKNVVYEKKMHLNIIGSLDIYRHAPWDLPALAKIGEREWYFFVPRDRKYGQGGRPNRTTEHGFWKATGSDRKIFNLSEPKRFIGLRKTLVFYQGRAPRGSKTDWVMNEYRLPDDCAQHKEIVLCKIYRKATSLKELEERAAKEETMEKSTIAVSCPTSPHSSSNETVNELLNDDISHSENYMTPIFMTQNDHNATLKKEDNVEEKFQETNMMPNNFKVVTSNNIKLPFGKDSLGELQVPKLGLEWAQDPIFSLSCSPWFENLLNFSSPTLISQFLSA